MSQFEAGVNYLGVVKEDVLEWDRDGKSMNYVLVVEVVARLNKRCQVEESFADPYQRSAWFRFNDKSEKYTRMDLEALGVPHVPNLKSLLRDHLHEKGKQYWDPKGKNVLVSFRNYVGANGKAGQSVNLHPYKGPAEDLDPATFFDDPRLDKLAAAWSKASGGDDDSSSPF